MLASSIPPKFSLPFASGAGSANIRSIPAASQINVLPGAASLTDGFPPLNFTPIAAGGIPPFGQDMNGILHQITLWNQWHAAGGPVKFDASFAAQINGYPSGALVQSNSGHAVYESVVDNNVADPNSGSTQWRINTCVWSSVAVQATGSANVQAITLNPAPTNLSQLVGIPISVTSQGVNTGPITLNPNGFGNISILTPAGVQLGAGTTITGAPFTVIYNGTSFTFQSTSSVFADPGEGGVTIDGSNNTAGANLFLKGNGATTPNKFLRAVNGVFQIISNAYTTAIATLDDVGNWTVQGFVNAIGGFIGSTLTLSGSAVIGGSVGVSGVITSTGNITTSGRLRAAVGALNSGDSAAATILADFIYTNNASGICMEFPSGYKIQSGTITANTGTALLFPVPFEFIPNVQLTEGNGQGSWGSAIPTLYAASNQSTTQCIVYALKWTGSGWANSGGTSCAWVATGF